MDSGRRRLSGMMKDIVRNTRNPLIIGLIAVFLLGLALAGLTDAVLDKESIVRLDNWVLENTHLVQSPGLTCAMLIITSLGAAYVLWPVTFLAVFWFLYKKRRDEARFIAAVMAGGEIINLGLKYAIHRARPLPPGGGDLAHAWGWAYPSGHALMSTVFYFSLAYFIYRRFASRPAGLTAFAIAFFIACAIALSRVYLQVHYLSDVVAGFLAGLIWFIVCAAILEHFRKNEA
jgi:undecaprenyl-diphosphatase